MKKPLLLAFVLLTTGLYAQEHFAGINTSRRTGIINSVVNPAELTNLKKQYEVSVLNVSVNESNNKITLGDILDGDDLDDLIFTGNAPVDVNANIEIYGPAFAFKIEKWAFAITTAAKAKATVVDVNTQLGRALTTNTLPSDLGFIFANYNQRAAATTWGELGFSAARDIFENEDHKISVGVTFKLLFPGSYTNIAVDQLRGRLATDLTDVYLTDATANVNITYSGSLADGFTDVGNYTDFLAGGINGFSTDIGVNYRWKDANADSVEDYRINAGLAFQNMGKMTFKDNNNVADSYSLNIPEGQGLSLSQFDGVDNLEEIEERLLESGFVTLASSNRNFKVNMPATMSLYADVKVYSNWYITGFLQQKMNETNKNDQMAAQNLFTATPRYSGETFEIYAPFSTSEISGFSSGIGFRIGGFYLGSGSAITALLSDTEQADVYLGFRFGF